MPDVTIFSCILLFFYYYKNYIHMYWYFNCGKFFCYILACCISLIRNKHVFICICVCMFVCYICWWAWELFMLIGFTVNSALYNSLLFLTSFCSELLLCKCSCLSVLSCTYFCTTFSCVHFLFSFLCMPCLINPICYDISKLCRFSLEKVKSQLFFVSNLHASKK